jgi:hypothetical protein
VVSCPGDYPAPVWARRAHVPGAEWLRLRFSVVLLGEGSVVRIISEEDGATQEMDASEMRQWRNTSAYFNGDAVVLVLIAAPHSGTNRIAVERVTAGLPPDDLSIQSICGDTDDRTLSDDARAARMMPIGCTGWLIDDMNHCFLTAGHCASNGSLDVAEFNVPLSGSGGSVQHPPPSDQYAVDPESVQYVDAGVGDDWCYFGCFENSETGLTPYQAQGDFFVLAEPPPVSGQDIRVTGYGTTGYPVSPTWNKVQKTHAGPYVSLSGTHVSYQTDTTNGNSGSPAVDDTTSLAIAIHTHGGCNAVGGANNGTGINNQGLQDALASPEGVCARGLAFTYANGKPLLVDPAGGTTVRVEVSGELGHTPEAGTGMFHYDIGAGFVAVPLEIVSDNVYDVVFPSSPCGTVVRYYVSAEDTDGHAFSDPLSAPTETSQAISAYSPIVVLDDDFETDQGWTVENSQGLTDGAWERGVPAGGGDRGDPPTDYDGSGQCFVTGNEENSDVDGGTTYLISPALDLSAGDAIVSYARWYSNHTGNDGYSDVFQVWVSNNDGYNWVVAETVGPGGTQVSGSWHEYSFVVSDFVTQTNQVRIRFAASDLGSGSVVEAGIDAFKVIQGSCVEPASLSGTVDLELLAGSPAGRTVTIQFRAPGTTNVLHSYDAELDADGNYSVPDVESGTFDLAVKHDNWLRRVLASQVVSGATTADFSLTNGDADGSNTVDILDVNTVLTFFGSEGGPGDLNWDAAVDLLDLNVTVSNFGAAGDA